MAKASIDHFRTDNVTLGIVGLGYVGVPLAVEAAKAGIPVMGFDVKEQVVDGLNAGRSHIQDVPSEVLKQFVDAGLFQATTDMSRMRECDAISICVPTPLSKTRDPDVSFILASTQAVAASLVPGQLITLESTTYPGTTREILLPALEESGLKVGEDFYLCFSPERVDPGNETWQTRNTPKVLGGITAACTEAGVALYARFIDTMVPVSSTEAAEMTKILENTFRAVNIGLVNETAIIAGRLGVDVHEVIEAAATKPFGFMKFTPGPGLGGHCIPIDPHYLSWKMRTLNYKTRFIELASEINAEMPLFVVGQVREALNANRKAVNGSRVLVLGVAYKKDIDDLRESPALDILRLLQAGGADVRYHDPFVTAIHADEEGSPELTSVELTDEALSEADVVVIVTDHSVFDYERIVAMSRVLVDARNATRGVKGRTAPGKSSWVVKTGLD